MKAEDLMIGDWVKFNNSDLVHQIKAIAGKSVKVDKVYWYSASKLSPIPITSEILGKNGFKDLTWGGWEYNILDNDNEWAGHIIYRTDYIHPSLSIDCFSTEFNCAKIYNILYIHELQHALRMCKIKKEIEL